MPRPTAFIVAHIVSQRPGVTLVGIFASILVCYAAFIASPPINWKPCWGPSCPSTSRTSHEPCPSVCFGQLKLYPSSCNTRYSATHDLLVGLLDLGGVRVDVVARHVAEFLFGGCEALVDVVVLRRGEHDAAATGCQSRDVVPSRLPRSCC